MNTLIKNKTRNQGPNLGNVLFNDEWFDNFFRPANSSTQFYHPDADIIEKEDKFLIQIALPGMKKEDIKVDLLDNKITISGELKKEEVTEKDRFISKELFTGSFYREFRLGNQVDSSKIAGNFENGILHLSIPKSEKAAPKAISIK